MEFHSLLRSNPRYYPAAIVVVAVIGILLTAYVYNKSAADAQKALLQQTSSIAYALGPDRIKALTGTPADLDNADYVILKERLAKIRQANKELRFIYLTGYRDGQPFFFVDSEPESSGDYSSPGEVYSEGSRNFRDPFLYNSTEPILENVSSDRWGNWLTAITPIADPASGNVIALLGADMSAEQYYRTVLGYSILPLLVAGIIIAILLLSFRVAKEERMAYRSKMAAMATNEIRPPISALRWHLDNLLETAGKELPETCLGKLETLKAESDRLFLAVNQILALAMSGDEAAQEADRREVDAAGLLKEAAGSLELLAQEHSLRIILDGSLNAPAVVRGNEGNLKWMFSGIVSNAIEYTRKPQASVVLSCERKGKSCIFKIKDEGIGIAAKDKAKVLRGFYRAPSARDLVRHGTGMGLHYAQAVVKAHRGRIWFESEEGKGTTFFVELPTVGHED